MCSECVICHSIHICSLVINRYDSGHLLSRKGEGETTGFPSHAYFSQDPLENIL